MKALSFKQPYAQMMLHGKIETRTWDTNYRGPVLICASKKFFEFDQIQQISGIHHMGRMICRIMSRDQQWDELQTGVAIAVGEITGTAPMNPSDELFTYVKYDAQLFCHVYENVRPIKPFPFKGHARWTNLDQGIIDQIEYL